MGRLKPVALARALPLAAAVAISLPVAALAADFLPPPPMMPPPPPIEVGSGWYLRGDVGVGALELRKFRGVDNADFQGPPGGYFTEQKNISDQAFAGGGVGYQFNGWLRGDLTAEYRTAATFKTVESYQYPGFDKGYDQVSGNISTLVGMANGYVDLGTWGGFTPYVGAGVGVAHHRLAGITDIGLGSAAGGFGAARERTTDSLAWALQAGIGYAVTPNVKLEVGYRYLNMGDVRSAAVTCGGSLGCPNTVYTYRDLDSHDVKIGLRWMLGGQTYAAAPAYYEPPQPPPAPPPLVRKY